MHAAQIARKALPSALAAFALLAGVLFAAAPEAAASRAQCPSNAVCVWEGRNYSGLFSWWPAADTGCHNHAFNPYIRSAWNRTGYNVRLGGWGTISPGSAVSLGSGSVAGQICWPV